MGDPTSAGRAVVQWEYRFDRLLSAKLEHAYQVLVPDHRWPIGRPTSAPTQERVNEQTRGHLRTRVV